MVKIAGLVIKTMSVYEKRATAVIAVVFSALFFAYSLQYTTPINVGDETGYLTKAAAVAGHRVDAASSYHAGYSILVAPAFLFSDPYLAWRAVLFINAIIWGLSFYVLFCLLRSLYPRVSAPKLQLITAACALYPSWISMSGHGFSTPAFVLILLSALLVMTKKESYKQSVTLGVLSGLLYWVHPMGLIFAAAAGTLLGVRALVNKEVRKYLIFVVCLLGTCVVYKFAIHPLLNHYMSPTGIFWDHYNQVAGGSKTSVLTDLSFWKHLGLMMASQAAAVVVSTFGIALYALVSLFYDAKKVVVRNGCSRKAVQSTLDDKKSLITATLGLSIAGAILIGSITFLLYWGYGPSGQLSVQHWIYGRYIDFFVLPLLAIGILSGWRYGVIISTALLVALFGVAIDRLVGFQASQIVWQLATISFWPIAFHEITDVALWFAIGSTGIFVSGTLVHLFGKKSLFVLLPMSLFTIYQYAVWHIAAERYHKQPTLYNVIDESYTKRTCIGFEVEPGSNDRVPSSANGQLNFLSFQSFSFQMHRMTLDDWYANCNGPYVTPMVHNLQNFKGAKYVAREESSGLYLIAKESDVGKVLDAADDKANIYSAMFSKDPSCVTNGCFMESSQELRQQTEVGAYLNNHISSSGKEGSLLYGPFLQLPAGKYVLNMNMSITKPANARLVVRGYQDKDPKVYLDKLLDEKTKNFAFEVTMPANNIEVIVYVSSHSEVKIYSYSIDRKE